jgi:hypothetical protein
MRFFNAQTAPPAFMPQFLKPMPRLATTTLVTGDPPRRTLKGQPKSKTSRARIPSAFQLPAVFPAALGREMRGTKPGDVISKVAVLT